MKKVTVAQLTQILLQRLTQPGVAIFANIKTDTDARLKKRGNPYPNVRKVTEMTVLLNTEYVSGVQNQLKREGRDPKTYKPGVNTMPLVFGENNHIIGFFNGAPVLQYRPFDNSHPKVSYYTEEGIPVAKENLTPFLPEKKLQSASESRQGTDKEILWRKTYLSNVLEMKIDGEAYQVIS